MKFIDLPTEQTSAITDVILAVVALVCAWYLRSLSHYDPWKAMLWAWAFSLLTLAASLGAIAHGFSMSQAVQVWLWRPLNLALGLVIALFVVGVVYDLWGLAPAKRAWPIMLVIAIIFWGVSLFNPTNFMAFIIYEATAMLFALGVYSWLAVTGRLAGAGWMVAGVLVTIIAAAVQALWHGKENPLTLIWQFDQNGLYHLIQMVEVVLLVVGLRFELLGD